MHVLKSTGSHDVPPWKAEKGRGTRPGVFGLQLRMYISRSASACSSLPGPIASVGLRGGVEARSSRSGFLENPSQRAVAKPSDHEIVAGVAWAQPCLGFLWDLGAEPRGPRN